MRNISPQKNKRAEKAVQQTQLYSVTYAKEIADSVIRSDIADYGSVMEVNDSDRNKSTTVQLIACDTVSALFLMKDKFPDSKTVILNFASYKNPGGGFIGGAVAQEEALCMESFLYNVLSDKKFMENHYEPNRKKLNNGIYGNNHIYSPDIRFFRDDKSTVSDVITCACPNRSMAIRYNQSLLPELNKAMEERTDTVLYSAYRHGAECLVLGAFGCGVFRNDPLLVAKSFSSLLEKKYKGIFTSVVFAVPDENSRNYRSFSEVFNKE